eukprot:3733108-Pyramimonas_sp.AAC.1
MRTGQTRGPSAGVSRTSLSYQCVASKNRGGTEPQDLESCPADGNREDTESQILESRSADGS